MKLKTVAFAAVLGLCCLQSYAANTTKPTTEVDKVSYTLGADMGTNFRNNKIDINPDLLLQGLRAALNKKPLAMTKKEMEMTLINFQKNMQARRKSELKQVSQTNKKKGEEFLAKNKKQKGVVTLADGMQYKVVTAGTGAKPKSTDIVTVNYEGSLVGGKVFDSSFKRGRPATFPVGQVIKGWQEILPMMKAGATWQVFIPSKLAYGSEGIGGVIGPNETLIFKINLLSIKGQKDKKS
jgi:FKBP-type peptidyl-prolyl cis-trans isomerase FklB